MWIRYSTSSDDVYYNQSDVYLGIKGRGSNFVVHSLVKATPAISKSVAETAGMGFSIASYIPGHPVAVGLQQATDVLLSITPLFVPYLSAYIYFLSGLCL